MSTSVRLSGHVVALIQHGRTCFIGLDGPGDGSVCVDGPAGATDVESLELALAFYRKGVANGDKAGRSAKAKELREALGYEGY